jgi:hypothetical protein
VLQHTLREIVWHVQVWSHGKINYTNDHYIPLQHGQTLTFAGELFDDDVALKLLVSTPKPLVLCVLAASACALASQGSMRRPSGQALRTV